MSMLPRETTPGKTAFAFRTARNLCSRNVPDVAHTRKRARNNVLLFKHILPIPSLRTHLKRVKKKKKKKRGRKASRKKGGDHFVATTLGKLRPKVKLETRASCFDGLRHFCGTVSIPENIGGLQKGCLRAKVRLSNEISLAFLKSYKKK